MISKEELVALVRAAVEQAVNELTLTTTMAPPLPACAVEVANAMRDLSGMVAQLTAQMAPAQDCERRVVACERALDEVTKRVVQPTNTTTNTTTTNTTTPAQSRCAPGYEYWSGNGHCYKLHQRLEVWSEAQKSCSRAGGHLAIINSRKEAQHLTSVSRGQLCFLGVIRGVTDRWVSVGGEEVIAVQRPDVWFVGEPYNPVGWYTSEGQRKTVNSGRKFCYICEMQPVE